MFTVNSIIEVIRAEINTRAAPKNDDGDVRRVRIHEWGGIGITGGLFSFRP